VSCTWQYPDLRSRALGFRAPRSSSDRRMTARCHSQAMPDEDCDAIVAESEKAGLVTVTADDQGR
jgi:hypothetical protein